MTEEGNGPIDTWGNVASKPSTLSD